MHDPALEAKHSDVKAFVGFLIQEYWVRIIADLVLRRVGEREI